VAGFGALAVAPRDDGPISPYLLAANAVAFAMGAVALLVVGAKDGRTRDLVGFFLAIAAACSHRPLRWLMTGAYAAPGPIALFRGLLPDALLPYFLWRFAGEFPRTLRLGWENAVVRTGVTLSAALGGVLFLANAVAYATRPQEPWTHPLFGWVNRSNPSGAYWTALFSMCVGALVVATARRRQSLTDERRRVSLFLGGLLLGIGPLLAIILAEFLSEPAKAYIEGPGLRNVGFAIYLPMLTVPLTLAYAVSARRMLEVTLTVRRGVRRILARSTLGILSLGTGGVLFWYLHVNRDRSLDALLRDPAARTLAFLFLAVCVLVPVCGLLIDALGSTSAERADRNAILTDLSARGRASRTLDEAITIITDAAARGLDVEWATLFVRDPEAGAYVPLGRSAAALPSDGGLAHIVETCEEPLVTEPTGGRSVFGWLPLADRQWILDNGAGAVVAMAQVSMGAPGFIAAGPKRTDLPWSREELSFLAAVASSAVFVLGMIAGRDARAQPTRTARPGVVDAAECLACGSVQPATRDRCKCGGRLGPSMLPLVLSGKFKVTRVLGRGGMGIVYAALDQELDRPVALKTLPTLSLEAASRMRREARSMATQIHPHLALIFGAESWRGVPVLVVEYLAGGTLRQRMGSRWSAESAVALGTTLGGALAAMHARGLLHRDVKPSNIAFTEDGTPKLLDFGLAEIAQEPGGLAPVGVAGTKRYLSPEALRGAHPAVAQDLWALAAVLYEVLAGTTMPPPSGRGGPDVRKLNPAIPEALAIFLMAALDPRPDRRFKAAAAFSIGLAATVTGGSRSPGDVRSAASRRLFQ
jgi:Protein kinase domain